MSISVKPLSFSNALNDLGLGEQPNLISLVRLIGMDAPDLRQSPWGDDAKKLGLFELGNLGITPNLSGEADVNLKLQASVDGSTLGIDKKKLTGVLPSIVSDFDLLWTFDNSVFSGNLGDLKTLAFKNVGLDLGSFFSDFLKPIVSQIQDITQPIQPIINVITQPLPVISQLAGEKITLIDLAKIFGYGDFGMIEDIADIITLINSIPTDAENVILPFGDLVLASK